MPCPGSDFRLSVTLGQPVPISAELACGGGELLALVGPSGSGKSTLLRLVAGLVRPVQGRIECGSACWFDSARGLHLSPQQRRVGFVPQHYGLFPHMTALGNVMAGLHALPARERAARARQWLARVHLAGLEQRRPAELSGGEQQRVALARALVGEPSILLLDEPFSAVDQVTRQTLHLELAELKQELGIPVILVTHDLDEALLLADHMTLLARGHTLQSGRPQAVMAAPVNAEAARLLGMRNLLPGTLLRHDKTAATSWIRAGSVELAAALAPDLDPGTSVVWMVPPGAMRLTAGAAASPADSLRVCIHSLLPLGDSVRVSASIPGLGAPLYLQIQPAEVAALNLQAGSEARVEFSRAKIRLLRA
ncbi:ABC transporter ATP-binding protein [Haliea sp. E1-2-M8]|uniref:ABC transporter ATP-binding protein n=1 Tax=Haliea sp. E1-2-M8 TaxID=3064706 RepID=UPI002720AF26|nr:ABC transporter ATP-binding protein [Haliea sp. E1-2-M8]MDO8863401.1 ABC transporter ATP-binding protein [Haliea sp. E1-2-M8]